MKCSSAQLAYQKKYYEENREDRIAYQASYAASHREEISALKATYYTNVVSPQIADRKSFLDKSKAGVGCADCGSTELLHFHHRDKATKKYNVANMLKMPWCDIMDEIFKCDVLCNSCHGKMTRRGR